MIKVLVGDFKKDIHIKNKVPISNPTENDLLKVAESVSLFGEPQTYVVDEVTSEVKEFIFSNKDIFSRSKNDFIFCFNSLLKKERDILSRVSTEVVEEKRVLKKESPSVFKVTTAYAEGDKALVWSLFLDELKSETEIESVYGAFVWLIKSAVIVSRYKDHLELLEVKPFTAKTVARLSKRKDLDKIYFDIIYLGSRAHTGSDFKILLEKFILETI